MEVEQDTIDHNLKSIFTSLQRLLELAAPDMRKEAPERFEHLIGMVSAGEASFGAKVSTVPGMVTLTINLPNGERDLVTFMYTHAGGMN